jgi:hypothetical protein
MRGGCVTTISLEPGITAVKPPAVLTHRRPVKGIVALVGLIVVAGFLVILSLNMAVAQGAFTVALLEEEAAALSEREQALLRQVAQLESPASLATKAKALGMQPAPGGSFLRLADGTMVGPGVPKKLQKPAGGRDKP